MELSQSVLRWLAWANRRNFSSCLRGVISILSSRVWFTNSDFSSFFAVVHPARAVLLSLSLFSLFIHIDLPLNGDQFLSFFLDASSTSKRTNNFYLIHHRSSLIPVKDLLKEAGHSKIEIIQMDEQDCVLEIVDGVLTLVPKEKSSSSASNSEVEKSREHRGNSLDYPASHQRGKIDWNERKPWCYSSNLDDE